MLEEQAFSTRISHNNIGVIVLEDAQKRDEFLVITTGSANQLHEHLYSEWLDMLSPSNEREDVTQGLAQADHVKVVKEYRVEFRQVRSIINKIIDKN